MTNVAVLGAGEWGTNLVRTLAELDALAMVADPSGEVRARVQAEHNVHVVANARDVLHEGIDAVAIATPAPTHHAVAKEAMLAGKDVFVEKPMTITSADAEDLVRVSEGTGRILMVGHLLVYQPAVAFIKDQIQSGAIGDLVGIHQERLKLGRVRSVENVLWSFGVHDIAVQLDLIGRAPDSVAAYGQAFLQPAIHDDVHLHLGFGNVKTSLHTSWLWPEVRRRMTIVGSDGMLVFNEPSSTVTHHRKSIGKNLQNVDAGGEEVFVQEEAPLAIEMKHFLDCVRDRKQPRSGGRQGLEVVQVLERADESLEAV